ncbi:hypothetical protein M1R94_03650 [Actinotalea sp. K2]|nr:hypothetical protein [Actinotalea sp. K2]
MKDEAEQVEAADVDPEVDEAAVDTAPAHPDDDAPTPSTEGDASTPSPEDEAPTPSPEGEAPEVAPGTRPAPPVDADGTELTSDTAGPPVGAHTPEPGAANATARPGLDTSPPPGRTTATEPAVRSHAQPPSNRTLQRRRRRRRAGVALLVLLVLALGSLSTYLYLTTEAWQEHAERYLATAEELGEEVWATQASLDGARAELEAVREQLRTAQGRIITLADEKAQIGDDREIARQLSDYQARVTDAAGRVALALDECVQGQQMLIGYLENAEAYDQEALDQFAVEVDTLCQAATEANIALQRELAQ